MRDRDSFVVSSSIQTASGALSRNALAESAHWLSVPGVKHLSGITYLRYLASVDLPASGSACIKIWGSLGTLRCPLGCVTIFTMWLSSALVSVCLTRTLLASIRLLMKVSSSVRGLVQVTGGSIGMGIEFSWCFTSWAIAFVFISQEPVNPIALTFCTDFVGDPDILPCSLYSLQTSTHFLMILSLLVGATAVQFTILLRPISWLLLTSFVVRLSWFSAWTV